MSIVSRYRRGILLDRGCAHVSQAADAFEYVLLSADTEYATQEMNWQEGEAGARHCAASEKLRQAVLTLRGIELPDAGEMG